MRCIHFPRTPEQLRRAQYRLKFEELFYVQLGILRYAKERIRKYRGFVFARVGEMFNTFYSHYLPFELTGAQKRVIREIRRDVGSGRQMNRLLQGDVGSGKTLVALMCMLIALDNGYQACLMAPTEILASQHYETLRRFLGEMPVRVELLTGSVKGKKREEILRGLTLGEVHILIGTHAVLEDTVNFASLGMVVIDEQHRFGVAQRAKLWNKNTRPPHVLVMTATPIPRTLAMTLYGDLDVSVIDELPPGRKPIRTIHQFDNRRENLYAFIRGQIRDGRQVYIVYPLIQESEKSDLKNLEDGYGHICEAFPEYQVSKVHGKMKPADNDAEMQRFVRGETQIMVATTVIEVGVNVPNASVMVVENAERFGLSQLHQLRGRVGRGADQSYCVLVTGYKLTEDTRKRIEIMVNSNDGFEIAEADFFHLGVDVVRDPADGFVLLINQALHAPVQIVFHAGIPVKRNQILPLGLVCQFRFFIRALIDVRGSCKADIISVLFQFFSHSQRQAEGVVLFRAAHVGGPVIESAVPGVQYNFYCHFCLLSLGFAAAAKAAKEPLRRSLLNI